MNPPNLFTELKRRNVYKVAVAYAVVAWLVIQIATQVFPFLQIPDWAIRLIIMLLAFGFPIAITLAWAFELTPEGVRRTESSTDVPRKRRSGRVWLLVVSIAAALSVALFLLGRYSAPLQSSAPTGAKSIAGLPFENRSEEKANAYLADGIQNEILTRLAKIDALKVISRTSTQRYKASPENLPEIARQLGVAHVLEGSVQKEGEQVRVTVQLISAATDSHVWAETFDRKLTDIFAVESEIAESIAKSLRARLTPGEKRAVMAKPTDNAEAYEAYLRGLALWNGLNESPETLQRAENFFRRAVELDPHFALAWANLSIIQTFIYAEFEPMTQRLTDAKRALDTAKKLQPELGDGYFALGLYRYRGLRDYDGALRAFEEAIERGANRAMALEFAGYVKRRQGKWEETLAMHEESSALDPRNPIIFSERAVTYRGLRRFAEARAAVDRALEINSDSPLLLGQKARIYQAEGDFEAAQRLIERLPLDRQQPELVGTYLNQWICTRHYAEAVRAMQDLLADPAPLAKHLAAAYRARLGVVKSWSGDLEGARVELTLARDELELLRRQSDGGEGFVESMIVVEALLGDEAAVDRHALILQPQIAKDLFYGPALQQAVAAARANLGQADVAIPLLRDLLRKPGDASITPALLRADPIWDPLRNDPRFQELIATAP